MYATIDIGNPRMTSDLLKGNPCTLMYAGCNADSRVQYVSYNGDSRVEYAGCNGDSHVHNSTLRKIMQQAGLKVNASQVMPI